MRPRPTRWIALAAAPVAACAAAASAGCAAPPARSFAVVLAEPALLECNLVLPPEGADVSNAAQIFASLTTSWRSRWDAGLLRPAGGHLNLVHDGEGALAWFEGLPQGQYSPWNGVVFEGEPHDDHAELESLAVHDSGDPTCAVLLDADSELLATIDGGALDGRVRRMEYIYFPSMTSFCGAHIECSRNIALSGAEED